MCYFTSSTTSLDNNFNKVGLLNVQLDIFITFQVIQESLRMASIVSFTFREAVVDVEYKGKDSN